jgi:hypothetical protein
MYAKMHMTYKKPGAEQIARFADILCAADLTAQKVCRVHKKSVKGLIRFFMVVFHRNSS